MASQMFGICNGYDWVIKRVEGGYIAICDGWYKTEVKPTPELARMAARIWLSSYGG